MDNIIIEKAKPEDAKDMLEFFSMVGGESDNLTFGSEGLPISEEVEAKYIENKNKSGRNIMILAKRNGEIIGNASLDCMSRRMSHRGSFAIAVRKDYWGNGVGSLLLETIIKHAQSIDLEIISLEVRSDHVRAIKLYEKYGFVKIGMFPGFFKIGQQYVDFDLMNLYLKK